MKVKARAMSALSKSQRHKDSRKKMTVTTLNLSIEALVWKLKTFCGVSFTLEH